MTRLLGWTCLLLISVSCKRGERQIVILKNLSPESVFFVTSANRELGLEDLARIRPSTSDLEMIVATGPNPTIVNPDPYLSEPRWNLIETNGSAMLLSSESAEMFANSISIQRIINDRYNGEFNVFLIEPNVLLGHTDQEIVEGKLYTFFVRLTERDITADTVILKYR